MLIHLTYIKYTHSVHYTVTLGSQGVKQEAHGSHHSPEQQHQIEPRV